MTTRTGNQGYLTADGTAIAELKSWSLEMNAEQIDDTAMGDTYKTSRSGMPSANGQIECHADHADAGQNSLLPGQTVDLVLYPDGNSTGNERISLTAQITGRSRSGAIDAIQPHTFNYSLSEGTVTFDTVP